MKKSRKTLFFLIPFFLHKVLILFKKHEFKTDIYKRFYTKNVLKTALKNDPFKKKWHEKEPTNTTSLVNQKISLKEISLCIIDCINPELSIKAIKKSQHFCDFENTLFFTDQNLKPSDYFDVVPISSLNSIKAYSHFILKKLHQYIQTSHVLIIQWDGFVIDPNAWRETFRTVDYIGAKWEWRHDGNNVGNGGFSLRSKRLLSTTAKDSFKFIENEAEDHQLCRTYKHELMRNHGIKFADETMADQFSYERSMPNIPTFGFHGLFNFWRHHSDEEMINIISQLTKKNYQSREFIELLIEYFLLRKFNLLKLMINQIKQVQTKEEFRSHLFKITNDKKFSLFLTDLCESL